jgi:hypothetical protein
MSFTKGMQKKSPVLKIKMPPEPTKPLNPPKEQKGVFSGGCLGVVGR